MNVEPPPNFEEVRTESRSTTGCYYKPDPPKKPWREKLWWRCIVIVFWTVAILSAVYNIANSVNKLATNEQLVVEEANWSLEHMDKLPVWKSVTFPLNLSKINCSDVDSMSIYLRIQQNELTGGWALQFHELGITHRFSGDSFTEKAHGVLAESVTCYPNDKYKHYEQDDKSFCVSPK